MESELAKISRNKLRAIIKEEEAVNIVPLSQHHSLLMMMLTRENTKAKNYLSRL